MNLDFNQYDDVFSATGLIPEYLQSRSAAESRKSAKSPRHQLLLVPGRFISASEGAPLQAESTAHVAAAATTRALRM